MPTTRINYENENQTHFLTITIIEWIDIFTKPQYFQIIIDSLKYCQKNKWLLLYEFVIITNHLHLIVKAEEGNKLFQIISDFKKHTTREILKELEKDNRRYILNLRKLWKTIKSHILKFIFWFKHWIPSSEGMTKTALFAGAGLQPVSDVSHIGKMRWSFKTKETGYKPAPA